MVGREAAAMMAVVHSSYASLSIPANVLYCTVHHRGVWLQLCRAHNSEWKWGLSK